MTTNELILKIEELIEEVDLNQKTNWRNGFSKTSCNLQAIVASIATRSETELAEIIHKEYVIPRTNRDLSNDN